jgi:hypothetical protein
MIQKLILGYHAVTMLDEKLKRFECDRPDLHLFRFAVHAPQIEIDSKLAEIHNREIYFAPIGRHPCISRHFQRFFSTFSAPKWDLSLYRLIDAHGIPQNFSNRSLPCKLRTTRFKRDVPLTTVRWRFSIFNSCCIGL